MSVRLSASRREPAATGTGPAFQTLLGASLALLGVALVEAFLLAGQRPLGPLGWPGLGMAAAGAFAGAYGLLGGGAVVAAYYLFNLAQPGRFPVFFDGHGPAIAWTSGLIVLCAFVAWLRQRVQRAESEAAGSHALRESEQRFRDLVELSSDYFWEQDAALRFTARTDLGQERTAYPASAVIGRTRWELPALNMSEADWAKHRADLAARREFRDLVIHRPTPDGRDRYISTSGRPVFDGAGRFKGYRGVGRDITAQRHAQAALRDSEARLSLIAQNVPALVGYVDTGERFRFANRAYRDWFGLDPEALVGRTVREAWGEARYALIAPNMRRALAGERVRHEYDFLDKEGEERYVMANYVPDIGPDGAVRGFFVLGTDVTPLVSAYAELRTVNARLEHALEGSGTALWDADLRAGRVYLSEGWAGIVGAPRQTMVLTFDELKALVHPDDAETLRRVTREALKGLRPYALEHRVRAANGEWRWILSRGGITERDPGTGRALRMAGTNIDITDRKRIEQALETVAQSDPLTGVANRILFEDRLHQALARSRRSGGPIALLYLDVDRFKHINDTLGHAAGDEVLKGFAARLRAAVRASDTVARLGGDEFVVLLEAIGEPQAAVRIAEKVLEAVRAPLRVEDREVSVTTSIGVAHSGADSDAASLLRRADEAMYEAKSAGRSTCRLARPQPPGLRALPSA